MQRLRRMFCFVSKNLCHIRRQNNLNMCDVEKSKKIFLQKCAQCHTEKKGGKRKTRPNLHDLLGWKTIQPVALSYTDANKNKGITWGEMLMEYLVNSKKYIPGTKNDSAGIMKEKGKFDSLSGKKILMSKSDRLVAEWILSDFLNFDINSGSASIMTVFPSLKRWLNLIEEC